MQLSLPLPPASPVRRGRGGARPGAGRPRLQDSESHRRRAPVSPRVPQHVTMRMAEHVWNLRAQRCFEPLRRVLGAVQRPGFRVVHYSVQGNHLHLLVEADDHAAFGSGLRSLAIRVARALNRVMGRRGRVLGGRTHARPLHTPTEVKRALRYVLLNRNHHVPDAVEADECSTAPWFRDWAALEEESPAAARAGPRFPCVAVAPKTWLLSVGYRRGR